MKTHSIKPADINKEWVIVDCADQSLGRISSQIAYLLRGKHKPSFVPHLDCGDNVIAINADKVNLHRTSLRKNFITTTQVILVGLSPSLLKVLWKRNQKKLFLKLLKGCFLRISSLVVLS